LSHNKVDQGGSDKKIAGVECLLTVLGGRFLGGRLGGDCGVIIGFYPTNVLVCRERLSIVGSLGTNKNHAQDGF